MTDTIALRNKIDASGYKLRWLAEHCGLSYQGLMNKINNVSTFRAPEIKALVGLLKLSPDETDAIFFADKVDKTPTA